MRGRCRHTIASMGLRRTSRDHRACLIAVVAAAALGACTEVGSPPNTGGSGGNAGAGGGAGTGGMGGDGGMGGMAGAGGCDPVAQTGCSVGEKCTGVVVSQTEPPPCGEEGCLPTRCVSAGTQGKLDACTFGEPGDTGFDDCEAGLFCFDGACLEICTADPDSCPAAANERCQQVSDVFVDRPGTGVCLVQCDPLGQDCPDGLSCFVANENGNRVCADPNPANVQGATCEFPSDCAAGHGCLLIRSVNDPTLTCAYFCDPEGLPEGDLPTCSDAENPGPTIKCERIVDFYDDADFIGPDLGFCVDPAIFPAAL